VGATESGACFGDFRRRSELELGLRSELELVELVELVGEIVRPRLRTGTSVDVQIDNLLGDAIGVDVELQHEGQLPDGSLVGPFVVWVTVHASAPLRVRYRRPFGMRWHVALPVIVHHEPFRERQSWDAIASPADPT
jgi:hypothetical protein